jgi:hypothetical protein
MQQERRTNKLYLAYIFKRPKKHDINIYMQWKGKQHLCQAHVFFFFPIGSLDNTGRFIMFFVITNIHNKKTNGPSLLEMFIDTGKLKNIFFDNYRCSCQKKYKHQHNIQVLATHASIWVNRYSSLLQSSVSVGQREHVLMFHCSIAHSSIRM